VTPTPPGYWPRVFRDGVLLFVVVVGLIALTFMITSGIGGG
jgi:hypothetical protein